jgi:hypothetical protein
MARRYREVQRRRHVGDFSWLPEFAEKMAPPFVTLRLSFPRRQTSRLDWFVELFTIGELKSALRLCKNSSPGMDNVRAGVFAGVVLRQFELGADPGGLEAYANCYDPETGQGSNFGGFLATEIVYPQVVRMNAFPEIRAMG